MSADSKMDAAVAGLASKSDKIRALNRAGYKRSQIADYVGVRYQFVRNVLVDEERRAGGRAGMTARGGPAEDALPKDTGRARRIEVSADGSLRLSAELLAAAGVAGGGVLLARAEDGGIKLMTPEMTTRKIQAELRKYVPEGASLVNDLIEERRREGAA